MALPPGVMGLSALFVIVVFPDHTHLLFMKALLSGVTVYQWIFQAV